MDHTLAVVNPFTGRDSKEVWRELYKFAVRVERDVTKKKIEEIIKERKTKEIN